MPPLDGPTEKLGRAKVHLDILRREAEEFSRRGYDNTKGYLDSKDGSYVFDIEWATRIDYGLSLLVGDATHNMRCALDHLAYLFHPTDWTEFPVYIDPTHKDLARKLKWFPDNGARAYIEELQPYKRTYRARIIEVLHDLDRFDKHRFLLLTPGRLVIPNTHIKPTLRRLDDGHVELRFASPTQADIQRYEAFQPEPAFGVGLSAKPAGEVIPMQFLWEMHQVLDQDIVPGLASFLP